MGQSQSVDTRNRKTIEFEIFDKSFQMIEKYVKNTNGLSQKFRREYDSVTKRVVDWSRVLNRHLRNGRNTIGYIDAIKQTGKHLRETRLKANRTDKKVIDKIYKSVDHLIRKREDELDPKLSLFCIVLWGGEAYDSHKVVVDAWKQFKSG